MSWVITCLWDSKDPSDGSYPNLGEITHLLTLKVQELDGRQTSPGFTISYRQSGFPSILRFEPQYTTPSPSNAAFPEWRSARPPFTIGTKKPQTIQSHEKVPDEAQPQAIVDSQPSQQKSLLSEFTKVESKLKEKLHQAVECIKTFGLNFCPKHRAEHVNYQKETAVLYGGIDDPTWVDVPTPTSSVEQPSATPTPTTIPTLAPVGSHHSISLAVTIKAFLLSFALLSFLTWTFVRCRDPRRRAERAAQREERYTKRLYARAARIQKFKLQVQSVRTTVWNFRVKYGLASAQALLEDEKQRHVSEQEKFFEGLVEDDIRAFRDTHRVVSALANPVGGAEEGRAGYMDVHGRGYRRSRSMRSVSTLPEYDSEGSRPPSYCERVRRDSFNEFTSDSSVVSTSPRISRDGTSSDYEEKIEDISLGDPRYGASRPGQ